MVICKGILIHWNLVCIFMGSTNTFNPRRKNIQIYILKSVFFVNTAEYKPLKWFTLLFGVMLKYIYYHIKKSSYFAM